MMQLLAFITSIAPIGIYTGLNWDRYAPSTVETWKVGIGGAVVFFIMFLKAIKKANLPKGLFGYLIALGIVWALQVVLADLVNILLWATVGEGVDEILIEPQINKIIESKKTDTTALAVAKAVQQIGTGRV